MHQKITPLTFAILAILQINNASATPQFSGTEYTYYNPQLSGRTPLYQYLSNININGCSLTNIGFKNNNTGTFKITANGNDCNIEEYLNPLNTNYTPAPDANGNTVVGPGWLKNPTPDTATNGYVAPNPYYQQRDYSYIGNIYYANGSIILDERGRFINQRYSDQAKSPGSSLKAVSNTATNADYLAIQSDRASTALVEVAADAVLNVGKNFYVQQATTNAAAFLIHENGTADINGNLAIWRKHSPDPTGTLTDSRLLDIQGGTLVVANDLMTTHMESDISRLSGASWLLTTGSKILVGGNATLYQNTEAYGISANQSTIDITGDLKLFVDKRADLSHRAWDDAPVIYNQNSDIKANSISISSEGFVGINQSGSNSITSTNNLNIDTTANNYNNTNNIDKAIIISGGKIVSGLTEIKTNGDALTINGFSSISLGASTTNITTNQTKALIQLGKQSKINSISSNGIVIADGIDSEIDLQNGTQVTVGANQSLISDGTGDAIVNIHEGADVSGKIILAGGDDTINLIGTVNLDKIPVLDGGADATNSEFNTINFNGSQYTNLDTTKFTNFQDFHLTNNSNITLLNTTNNVFKASTINNHGIFIENGSLLNTQGSYLLDSNLNNAGTLDIRKNEDLGSIVTISNDYTGNNGHLIINTQLDDDASLTDKLIITGKATGSTELQVKNTIGTGAQTINGIHVIQTGSSESDQTFYLNGGAVSAGAYDYLLHLKKQETTTDGTFDNWYLESKLRLPTPIPPTDIPVYTPDVGEYLAAETMGNTLFTSRLEDREGASQYQNLGNQDTGNVWIRAYGGHHQFKSMQDQLKTTGNSVVTQIGTGLVTLGEEDQYNFGAMTGFATYDGKTRSNLTDRESKTKIDGYSLGLYGTWYAYPVEKRGTYIDSWVLWNKFNNKIDTPDQNQYKYDSSGITASIEVGGDYLINKNGKKNWWIQPQSQVIYQGVHADDFKDAQGVDINHGKDNLQARLGFKTYLNIPTNGSQLTSYRPYVALNFIHNTDPYSVVINDIRYENEGSANLGELKLGIEGNVTKNSQVWLNASYVAGSHDNQAYQGNIGWKYNF